jgi:hypothetical protein
MKELSQKYLVAVTNSGIENKILKKQVVSDLTKGDDPLFPAIIEQGTQISVIRANNSFEFIAGILGIMINDFCGNFNTRNPMSEDQIADLAIELVNDYWCYKLEDFVVFFSLAKRGRYGKVYDRMDAATIYQLLAEYNKDRDNGLIEMQTQYTRYEKSGRSRPDGEDINDGVTMLAGAFSKLKETFNKNQETINKLKPD